MTNKEAIEILKPLFDQCKGTDNCLGYIEHYFSKDEEKALDLAIQALEERQQGEWKGYIRSAFHGVDEWGEPIYRPVTVYNCTKCGRRTVIKENFCPKCGADMRGTQCQF